MSKLIFSLGLYFYIALCCVQIMAAQDQPLRTNIVIIFTDDQGYGDLGCYGLKTAKTPHLD